MPSDPGKVANVRAAIRHRSKWITEELARVTASPAGALESVVTSASPFTWLANFSRQLLKGFEHTWGLRYDACYGGGMGNPGNMTAHDYQNSVFHAVRADVQGGYARKNCEVSWTDQTNWAVKWALEAVENVTLRDAIAAEQATITSPTLPDPSAEGFTRASFDEDITIGRVVLNFSSTNGAMVGLTDETGVQWASESNPLGLFTYSLYTNDQMKDLRSEYCPNGCNANEFGKPGMPLDAAILASPVATGIWLKKNPKTGGVVEILTLSTMQFELNTGYGAPSAVWARVGLSTVAGTRPTLSYEVTLVNKTSTRFAEAGFVTFHPMGDAGEGASARGGEWAMDKLGEWVSPLDVADGGSMGMHPVWQGMQYIRSQGRAFFRTVDAAVVKFGEKLSAGSGLMLDRGAPPLLLGAPVPRGGRPCACSFRS